MANAGMNVLHSTPAELQECQVHSYITNLIFVEMSLLSSTVSSIGRTRDWLIGVSASLK